MGNGGATFIFCIVVFRRNLHPLANSFWIFETLLYLEYKCSLELLTKMTALQ
jgi:hypothetical protein